MGWGWRITVTVSAAIGVVAVIPRADPAAAQSFETRVVITVDGAPSAVASADPRLVRDGVDVTGRYCGGLVATSTDPRGVRTCTGLPDGTYEVRMVNVPDGAVTGWRCADNLVAGREDPFALRVAAANSLGDWGCSATVAFPGVVLADGGVVDDDLLDVGFRIDGQPFSPACEFDVQFGEQRSWCRGFAPSTVYEAVALEVPDGLRAAVFCRTLIGAPTMGLAADEVRVTPSAPLAICSRPDPFVPLIVSVERASPSGVTDDEDVSWMAGLQISVADDNGVGLPDACALVNQSGPGTSWPFVEFACSLDDDGTYVVEPIGIPPSYRYDNACDPVEVVVTFSFVYCKISVVVDVEDYPPRADLDIDDPFDPTIDLELQLIRELPETGRSSWNILAIAGWTTLVGLVLLVVADRRRRSGSATQRSSGP